MKISYIRKDKAKSSGQEVITICSEYVKDKNEILVAIAVCSKNDQFFKKDGIYIARRRFEYLLETKDIPSENLVKVTNPGEIDYTKFSRRVKYIGPEKFDNISHVVQLAAISMIWEDKQKSFGKVNE
jgi:hypothetical protein